MDKEVVIYIHNAILLSHKKEHIRIGFNSVDGTMHLSGQGVPFALVSIPLRYMHCPNEVGSLKDIENCIELLAQFLCDCTEDMCLKYF